MCCVTSHTYSTRAAAEANNSSKTRRHTKHFSYTPTGQQQQQQTTTSVNSAAGNQTTRQQHTAKCRRSFPSSRKQTIKLNQLYAHTKTHTHLHQRGCSTHAHTTFQRLTRPRSQIRSASKSLTRPINHSSKYPFSVDVTDRNETRLDVQNEDSKHINK